MASAKKNPADEPEATAPGTQADTAPTPEPTENLTAPAPESFTPYEARTRSLTSVRKKPDGIHVGFIPGGATVKAIERAGGQVKLENGLYVTEAMLDKVDAAAQ